MHERALALTLQNRPMITTEFILLELGNACARADDHDDFLELVSAARASPRVTIVPLSSGLLNLGLERMAQRHDKSWSLTDCISFVTMENFGLNEALTGDHHFEQAGFTILLRP